MTVKKVISGVMLVLAFPWLCSQLSYVQQKKGDKEVLAFASGFTVEFGGDFKPGSLEGSGSFTSSSSFQSFNIGGDLGYFITRRHEIGGGIGLSVFRSRRCRTSFSDGEITGEFCDSDNFAAFGVRGFYRYNFTAPEARGFPFVGVSVGVSDVTTNFTGNVSARPHAGYKYFLKKNVGLDFSVGYFVQVNKVDDEGVFIQDRKSAVNVSLG